MNPILSQSAAIPAALIEHQKNMLPSNFFSRSVPSSGSSTFVLRSSPSAISFNEGELIDPCPELSSAISAYLRGEAHLDSISIDESNSQLVLNTLKYVDLRNDRLDRQARKAMQLQNTTYELRTLCLQASNGKMQSFEAYTKSMNPKYFDNPFSPISRAYAAYSDNYIPERVALHAMVLRQYTIEIHALAQRYDQTQQPVIYALRGNTATGKTWSAKNDPECRQGLDENGEMVGSLATDRVKGLLRKNVNRVTNQQIHFEGAALNGRITGEMRRKAVGSTMIVDELLKFSTDIQSLIHDAKNSGKTLVIKDLDAPLAISALRVLTRDVNTEPCAPMTAIEMGLLAIRENRKEVLNQALASPTVSRYELHVMSQTGRTGLAAFKQINGENGVLKIVDPELFQTAMGDSAASQAEIQELKGKTVGELASRFPGKVNTEKLKPYLDLPIDQALLHRSKILPEWSKRTA